MFLLHTIIVVEYIAYFSYVEQPEIPGVEILGLWHYPFKVLLVSCCYYCVIDFYIPIYKLYWGSFLVFFLYF